jgi:BirA family biotin operon repressor/biotin-[acetyl-CoA-carboxylase] ligase
MFIPLKTSIFGRQLHFFSEIGSTQDIAHTLATQGAPEGTIVIAEKQTHGRGRFSKKWESPQGGLWFSLILLPPLTPEEVLPIPLLFSYGIKEELKKRFEIEVGIKWPNDVIVIDREGSRGGKKIAGVLSEVSLASLPNIIKFLIVGIGINLNIDSSQLPEEAISVKELIKKDVDLVDFFSSLLLRLEWLYLTFLNQKNLMWINEELNSALVIKDKVVVWQETPTSPFIEAKAKEIDPYGRLILESIKVEKPQRITAINCHLLRLL